jgi:pilus assembly protein Flp/PilA
MTHRRDGQVLRLLQVIVCILRPALVDARFNALRRRLFQPLGGAMADRFKAFLANRSGATAIEYGLITALIAVAIIATLIALTSNITNTFNEVSGNLK